MSATVGQQLRQRREFAFAHNRSGRQRHPHPRPLLNRDGNERVWIAAFPSPRTRLSAAYAEFLDLDAEPLLAELEGKEKPAPSSQPSALSETPNGPEPTPLSKPESGDRSGVLPGTSSQATADNSPSDGSPELPEAIFIEVGKSLLRQRELLGLSLEDIERHTHLRQHYLQALEAGDMVGLPSPVQARGMLNNYAAFLGMDPEPLLLRFADGLQAQLQAKRAVKSKPRNATIQPEQPATSPRRRLFSTDMLIGGSIALFLIVFVVWGAIRIFTTVSTSAPTATAPSIAEVLLASSTPSETPTPLPPSATAPQPQQLFPTFPVITGTVTDTVPGPQQVGVQVYLTIRQRAWMRVTVDGKVEFEGRVTAGSAYPFVGGTQVEVLTGNGAAIQVFFNGDDYGVMGEFGQLIDQIYSPQGILAPTATITQTPSPTLPVTVTPARTSTPESATIPALP